jgi:hypothetical protein
MHDRSFTPRRRKAARQISPFCTTQLLITEVVAVSIAGHTSRTASGPPSPAASGADAPLRGNGSEGDANVPVDLPGLPAQVTPAGPRGVLVLAAASSRVSAW